MAGTLLSWAFNQPEHSDLRVIVTTEQPRRCKERLLTTLPAGIKRRREAEYDAEELYGHQLVYSSNSDFFKALLVRWSDAAASSSSSQAVTGRDALPLAVISLPSKESFPAARQMLQFLYTQQLDAGLPRSTMFEVLQLGDQYIMPTLRLACLQRLNSVLVAEWSVEERMQLCFMTALLDSDACAVVGNVRTAELRAAAKELRGRIPTVFRDLEVLWRSKQWRKCFCALPSAVAAEVLGSDNLVVASEDTSLVAALSWLRTAGKTANRAERWVVLQKVRLAQLSPWFLSWLLLQASEARELLPAASLTRLSIHQMAGSSEADRKALQKQDALLTSWATPRLPVSEASQAQELVMEASWGTQQVLDAVERRRAGGGGCAGEANSVFFGQLYFFNGLLRVPCLTVTGTSSSTTAVCLKLRQVLLIAGSVIPLEVGMVQPPLSFTMEVGSGPSSAPRRLNVPACHNPFLKQGRPILNLKLEDDALVHLSKYTADGRLSMKATIHR